MADEIHFFGQPQATGKFPAILQLFERAMYAVLSDVDAYGNLEATVKPNIDKEIQFFRRVTQIRTDLQKVQEVLRQQKSILGKIEEYSQNIKLETREGSDIKRTTLK